MQEQVEYYTAGATQTILGIDYNQLRSYVANGSIRRYKPAGRKHHVYLKEDVDRLAEEKRRDTEQIRIIDREELSHDNHLGNVAHSERSSAFLARG